MAHEIQFFLTSQVLPGQVLASAAEVLASLRFPAELRLFRTADTWSAAQVLRDSLDAGVTIEAHANDVAMVAAADFAASQLGAPTLENVAALVILTLSGDTDFEIVESLRALLADQLGGVEYDEVAGFRQMD